MLSFCFQRDPNSARRLCWHWDRAQFPVQKALLPGDLAVVKLQPLSLHSLHPNHDFLVGKGLWKSWNLRPHPFRWSVTQHSLFSKWGSCLRQLRHAPACEAITEVDDDLILVALDHGSTNGTFINKSRLEKAQQQRLSLSLPLSLTSLTQLISLIYLSQSSPILFGSLECVDDDDWL